METTILQSATVQVRTDAHALPDMSVVVRLLRLGNLDMDYVAKQVVVTRKEVTVEKQEAI
jgi:hypothetical protein